MASDIPKLQRILVFTSSRNESDPEHERMLAAYPELKEYEFEYLSILDTNALIMLIEILEERVLIFEPDYLLIHTGINFRMHPTIIVREILGIKKKTSQS